MSNDDLLDRIEDPTGRLSPQKTRKVTATGPHRWAGKYLQKTFRLSPEAVEAIDDLAKAEGMSISDAQRWLIARGLQAYFKDGERPGVAEQIVRTKPKLPSWEE